MNRLLQYNGTMDSHLFTQWFETRLMRELSEKSVIVMDNASFHSKKRLSLIVESHGHTLLFLPPYSPELNLIENFWAWLKSKLKSVLGDFACFDDAL